MGASRERKEAEESVAKIDKKDKKDKKEKKDKKDKKDKKRSETDGVHKNKDKSDKKDKKAKKEKLAAALDAHLQSESVTAASETSAAAPAAASAAASPDNEMADAPADADKKVAAAAVAKPIVRGAVVDFALPLATDKYQKKVFKIVKRAAKQQALLRGVKEVNKALRKAPAKNPSAASAASVPGVVVIAGDVNPAEVIMHLPLACEDVNAPYVFVASRGELGQAARTKRPTSVVMIKAEGRTAAKKDAANKKAAASKAESDDEDEGSYAELYQEFVKLTQKEYAKQMKGII